MRAPERKSLTKQPPTCGIAITLPRFGAANLYSGVAGCLRVSEIPARRARPQVISRESRICTQRPFDAKLTDYRGHLTVAGTDLCLPISLRPYRKGFWEGTQSRDARLDGSEYVVRTHPIASL